ncbi:MAG: hypothetical protein M3M99_05005 [Actinomycetota bacterium]|nr:hypothetical protein [Actinomycetota bacterium]
MRNLNRRSMSVIASGAVAVAALIPVASAGAGPVATKSDEDVVSYYLPEPKLPVSKRIVYQATCSQNCLLSATTELKLKGPDIGPVTSSATFTGGTIAEAFIVINKNARRAIKQHKKAAKLKTEITGTNLFTGEIDTDSYTFKFK